MRGVGGGGVQLSSGGSPMLIPRMSNVHGGMTALEGGG